MPIPFLDLPEQYRALKPEMDRAIQEVCGKAQFALGPVVAHFEEAFAAYCGVNHCVGVNSGTAALALLLQAHDIGPGDEIITVANTFFATAEAIAEIGATPVLVDCEESTALIDPTKIEAAITAKTKAIIPVHLYGQCADMDAIAAIAQPRGILVFEDAAQAHGARYKGKCAGSLSHGAAFSFYPGKNLGAYGEAGAVTTNDASIAAMIRKLRDHGQPQKYHHDCIGWNERMDGIQGAVLGVKLPHLDAWNARRRTLADCYRKHLPAAARPFVAAAHNEHVYHLFVVRISNRDRVQATLKEHGIETAIHYPIPIHRQPAFAHFRRASADKPVPSFPVTEKLASSILSLPMFPALTEIQVQDICNVFNALLVNKI